MNKEFLTNRGYTQEEIDFLFENHGWENKDESLILEEFCDYKELGIFYVDCQVERIDMMRDFIDYDGLGREIVKGDDQYIVLPTGCIIKVKEEDNL